MAKRNPRFTITNPSEAIEPASGFGAPPEAIVTLVAHVRSRQPQTHVCHHPTGIWVE
jgi:hypothetical protein